MIRFITLMTIQGCEIIVNLILLEHLQFFRVRQVMLSVEIGLVVRFCEIIELWQLVPPTE